LKKEIKEVSKEDAKTEKWREKGSEEETNNIIGTIILSDAGDRLIYTVTEVFAI
jgi:hypothetical protein